MKSETKSHSDLCVCCGEPVPEGRMVCRSCETGSNMIAPSEPSRPPKGIRKVFGLIKEKLDEPRD